jgi:hypothetical protein
MNDNAIKNYAMWARRELIAEVARKCTYWGILEKDSPAADADAIDGRVLTSEQKKQRGALLVIAKNDGYQQLVERAAYTWFNRMLAIRFMEVNDRLPGHVRIFSAADGSFIPQCLSEALDLPLETLDSSKVAELVQAGDDEALFRAIFLAQCAELAGCMPAVFEQVGSAMELLLPDNLLRNGGVIEQLVSAIPESDWTEGVEIVGWMYQYYVSERKDEVFASFKKGKKAERDAIAPATQLFTPNWIVRYLTENSLGRLWMLNHPDSKLPERMPYFIAPGEDAEAEFQHVESPEDITVIDPACGSGHILVYAFDLLSAMYAEAGYSNRDAARLIIEKNLTGLEIDPRAAAMSSFALTMKACELDSRFLRRGVMPRVTVLSRVEFAPEELSLIPNLRAEKGLLDAAAHLDECGSLLNVTAANLDAIARDLASLAEADSLFAADAADRLKRLRAELEPLQRRYDAVVANPPYMGSGKMNSWLTQWVKNRYPDSKSDLCTCFIERGFSLAKARGYSAMVTMESWMFLGSFEKMRKGILRNHAIATMVYMNHMVMRIAFNTCATVFLNQHIDIPGLYTKVEYQDLADGGVPYEFPIRKHGPKPHEGDLEALANPDCGWLYRRTASAFANIPNAPIAYWLPANAGKAFLGRRCGDTLQSAGRTKTHNNELYLRKWWEISSNQLGTKWRQFCNGGGFSKWAGLDYDVVNWSTEAIANYGTHGGLPNMDLCEEQGLCWGLITSSKTSFRIKPAGYLYSSGSPTLIALDFEEAVHAMAFLNSSLCEVYLDALNPTLNTTVNDVLALPCPSKDQKVLVFANQCVSLVEDDWNSFESSGLFRKHPLL